MTPTAAKAEVPKTRRPQSTTANPPASASLVEMLKRPATYPDRPRQVSLVETHISWVFLTDQFVYKLKKPVQFDFVDFSTPEARRRACLLECDLNQRMAPGIYLGVLPLTVDAKGQLRLNGRGQTVDWVVKMRRLPADRMLDTLIRTGQLTDADSHRLAGWLAGYYHRLSPIYAGTAEYRKNFEQHVRSNRSDLLDPAHPLPAETVKRCHAAQMRFLAIEEGQFDARVCDGRMVDGHGDLRPEHICLGNPVVFDCIEFNEELRRLDVADELAFLAMECDFLGANQVGEQIVDAYRRQSGDYFSTALWNFYKGYRACVRAKVTALRAAQADQRQADEGYERARQYLALADRYAAELGPPTLIVVCGLMGSGKTTLAGTIADLLGSDVLGTDEIRHELFGPSATPAAFNEDRYSQKHREQVYREMFDRADRLLCDRVSVVLDGAFLSAGQRQQALALAAQAGAVGLIVHCSCPSDVVLERISERAAAGGALSEARADLYALQQAEEEPLSGLGSAVEVDSTATLRVQKMAVVKYLRQMPVLAVKAPDGRP